MCVDLILINMSLKFVKTDWQVCKIQTLEHTCLCHQAHGILPVIIFYLVCEIKIGFVYWISIQIIMKCKE